MEIANLYIKETQAERLGYDEHAGPYNMDVAEQRLMLEACLRDFAHRPDRKVALVRQRQVVGGNGRSKEFTFIWATKKLCLRAHDRRLLEKSALAR